KEHDSHRYHVPLINTDNTDSKKQEKRRTGGYRMAGGITGWCRAGLGNEWPALRARRVPNSQAPTATSGACDSETLRARAALARRHQPKLYSKIRVIRVIRVI